MKLGMILLSAVCRAQVHKTILQLQGQSKLLFFNAKLNDYLVGKSEDYISDL